MSKIDLTLINKLVKELNLQHEIVEKVKVASVDNKQEYTVELAKALGLVSTIKMESELLIGDFSKLIKFSTGNVMPQEAMSDLYSSIFGPKPPKNQS